MSSHGIKPNIKREL